MLKNLVDYITDPDFLGGVATGITETIDKGEDRRNKTLDQLRTYGLEKTNRIEKEYFNDLDANEEQVKQLAAQLTPAGVSANSPEVLTAAQYLISTKTLSGAQAEAQRLYDQNKRYGTNQLDEIGVDAKDNGINLSFRDIAGGITRRPSPVNLMDSGVPTKPTFLERVFGGPTVEEEAQKSISNIESAVPDLDVLPIIAASGYDADLIIRSDMPIKDEIIRMKDKLKEAEVTKDKAKVQRIKDKIDLLNTAEIRERIASSKEYTPSEFRTAKNTFVSDIGERFNLDVKGDIIGGIAVMSFAKQTKNTILGMKIATRMSGDISDIRLSGNPNVANELRKLNIAIVTNRDYKIKIDKEYGVKTIELVDNKMFADFNDDDNDEDEANNASIEGNNPDDDVTGSTAAAYTNGQTIANTRTTGLKSDTPEIAAAVNTFLNLPPSVGGLDRNKVRRAVQAAIIAANPGVKPSEAMAETRRLLNS